MKKTILLLATIALMAGPAWGDQRNVVDFRKGIRVGLPQQKVGRIQFGRATLVAGAVVVANTTVTATSNIYVTSQVDGGAPGFLRVSTRTAGTSFTITSSSGTDTSTVAWLMIDP
jgi:hypothetical protein